jgi:hypothetical protein
MELNKIILPIEFFNFLYKFPSSGKDFRLVKAVLKNGQILDNKKVYHSSIMMLDNDQNILAEDIERIEILDY